MPDYKIRPRPARVEDAEAVNPADGGDGVHPRPAVGTDRR